MNITEYEEMKRSDNVMVLLVNGTPALRQKKYSPDTGEYVGDEETGIDIAALKKTVANLQAIIKDAEEVKNAGKL